MARRVRRRPNPTWAEVRAYVKDALRHTGRAAVIGAKAAAKGGARAARWARPRAERLAAQAGRGTVRAAKWAGPHAERLAREAGTAAVTGARRTGAALAAGARKTLHAAKLAHRGAYAIGWGAKKLHRVQGGHVGTLPDGYEVMAWQLDGGWGTATRETPSKPWTWLTPDGEGSSEGPVVLGNERRALDAALEFVEALSTGMVEDGRANPRRGRRSNPTSGGARAVAVPVDSKGDMGFVLHEQCYRREAPGLRMAGLHGYDHGPWKAGMVCSACGRGHGAKAHPRVLANPGKPRYEYFLRSNAVHRGYDEDGDPNVVFDWGLFAEGHDGRRYVAPDAADVTRRDRPSNGMLRRLGAAQRSRPDPVALGWRYIGAAYGSPAYSQRDELARMDDEEREAYWRQR